jgi:hypothetical protein
MVPVSPEQQQLTRLVPATTLAEIAQTVRDEPLLTQAELDAFYCDEIRPFRGADRMSELRTRLEIELAADRHFRAFFLGHPGVGKTTELARLLLQMKGIRPLSISVTSELNPASFRAYDLLLLILLRLVQAIQQPALIGFSGTDVEFLYQRVREHLSSKWTKHLRTKAGEFGAGVNLPFLKLLGNLKASREQGSEEYELSFVSELVELMNFVFAECNRLLKQHQKQSWMIVVEDFEKIGLSPSKIRETFTNLRPALQDLQAHILITIPVWLPNAADANIILPANYKKFLVPDLPVYDKKHVQDQNVVSALADLALARIEKRLFDEGVMEQCCIASGGNIRDLFLLIMDAMIAARLRQSATISMQDADGAIISLRHEYKQHLGTTGQDPNEITLDQKLERLVQIYRREDPRADVPDPVLYQLLQQRSVLQYDGDMWMGVHPLVVDLLIEFKMLRADDPGGSRSVPTK